MRLLFISADCASRSRMARKPGYEADVVPSVIELLVIDGLVTGGVRRALYQEYRVARSDILLRLIVGYGFMEHGFR